MTLFLAESGGTDLTTLLIPLVVVSLSMCIPIVAIITEHFQKKEKMRLMEKAIEHGVNPDELSFDDPPKPRMPYRAGMINLAVGVALLLGDRYVDFGFGSVHFPLMLGGFIVGLVGVALLINDYMNRHRFDNPQG